MNEISRIVDQLEREHAGDPWHGSPLSQILDGITHAHAANKPIAAGHSIWELVLHLAAWKNETRRRLSGAAAAEPLEGDWPVVEETSEDAWRQARARLELAHRLLVSAVRELPETRLFDATTDDRDRALGIGVTYYELLHGIVQHDVYHAGQIAILRKGMSESGVTGRR
ncbi:MAG TPA: DinB family protein [Vicinamibacterales bacterium]|nr:DinB family protein [Vicinamibacterales bacterium]